MIRPATPDDLAAITAIYRQAVLEGTGTFETEPPDEAEMAVRHGRIAGGDFPFLVAGPPSDVRGYAYAAPYRERFAYRFTLEDSIYVRQDQRGRGVGRALLDALIRDTTARGYRQMVAVVGDSDNQGSIRLHAAAGFTDAGVLSAVGWKFGRWLDVVLMQLALGEGSASNAT